MSVSSRPFHYFSYILSILLQILFKVINDSQNYVLLERARFLVRDCIESHRRTNSKGGGKQSSQQQQVQVVPTTTSVSALAEAIAIPLRTLVGELHWEKANHYTKIYYSSLHRKRTRMIHNHIMNRAAWSSNEKRMYLYLLTPCVHMMFTSVILGFHDD